MKPLPTPSFTLDPEHVPDNSRIVPCEACATEGRVLIGHPNDPHPRDAGPCPYCEGTSGEIVEVQELDQADWYHNVYLPNARKALRGEHVDRALLEGGTQQANEDQNWDSRSEGNWS